MYNSDYLTYAEADVLYNFEIGCEVVIYFDNLKLTKDNYKQGYNLLISEILPYLKKEKLSIKDFPIAESELSNIISMLSDKKITARIIKDNFTDLLTGKSIESLIEKEPTVLIDTNRIDSLVKKIIQDNPEKVLDYKNGNVKIVSFFIGMLIKELGKGTDPKDLHSHLISKLA